MSRKRLLPPSRIKYAYENPTIGIHVTREEREALRALSEESGLSASQLVKQTLGILKADIDAVRAHCVQQGITKGTSIGRREGRHEGFAEAKILLKNL